MDILQGANWDYRNTNPPNLESDVGWDEHIRIIKAAAALFANFSDGTTWSDAKSVGDADISELRARSAFGELKKFFAD